ncbi:hypothetical protein DMH25_43370 [Streptomyces sp. WAC 01325]|nr:hypothetical protein DMH25_43370 [Streptomyces sp. WAC 01325]
MRTCRVRAVGQPTERRCTAGRGRGGRAGGPGFVGGGPGVRPGGTRRGCSRSRHRMPGHDGRLSAAAYVQVTQ